MAKEWILNVATNRWGLNKKRNVGPTSKWIRECSPKKVEEWKECYYSKLRDFLRKKGINLEPEEYLNSLGEKLFVKISEVIRAEIEEVTEEDCKNYIKNLVIQRTFEGYKTEVDTVYKFLEKELGVRISPAPDEWDRLYNVDFFIEVDGKYVGIQVKPITYEQTPELHKWKEWMEKTHEKFHKEKGGKVFIIFSIKRNGRKEIYNQEVVKEIKKEIERLKEV